MSDLADWLATRVTRYSGLVVVGMLVLTVVVGAGMGSLETATSIEQFETDSPEAESLAYTSEAFRGEAENETTVQIVVRGDDVLTRESFLETLRLQRALRSDPQIAPTLTDAPFDDLASIVATAAMGEPGADPSLEAQIDQLEQLNSTAVEAILERLLAPDTDSELYAFLPQDYEPGSTTATARTVIVHQETDEPVGGGAAPQRITDAQTTMQDIVQQRLGDRGLVVGPGIVSDEINRSLGDSLRLVLPLAIVFVLGVLAIAYRDLLDIVLGLAGILLVLVWTVGAMGWLGLGFSQIMVAVPVLLVGLSIDYAIHVFMRTREARAEVPDRSIREAVAVVLRGLGVALVLVTAAAVIGFLANLVSPIEPIQEFGLASAIGITAALLIFGLLVPAAKIELDASLEARGIDRHKRAFGTGGGILERLLAGGATMAQRVPWLVVGLALLLAIAGAAGATQLSTTFEQEDFIADAPPGWMDGLPAPIAPGDYTAKQNLAYVSDRFIRQDARTQILLEGAVTRPDTFEAIDRVHEAATAQEGVVQLADGEASVDSPLSLARTLAAENETVAATLQATDTDDDGVPEENVTRVLDTLVSVAPARTARVVNRTGGEYTAMRLIVDVDGDATAGQATAATRELAAAIDTEERPATATGQLVVFHVVEQELLQTVLESLAVSFLVMVAFLMLVYRFRHGSAVLGAITLSPIALAVAWILGTMWLLAIPFNVMTGTITSLTVGLGVAYNIHIAERYQLERERGAPVSEALRTSTTGTGGALLGSAATTVGGFGVLVIAILPPLQQFGLITALTIVYAFLGSVFLLPSLLVLWSRYR